MRKFSLVMAMVFAGFAAIAQDPSLNKKVPDDSTHKEGWKKGAFVTCGCRPGIQFQLGRRCSDFFTFHYISGKSFC